MIEQAAQISIWFRLDVSRRVSEQEHHAVTVRASVIRCGGGDRHRARAFCCCWRDRAVLLIRNGLTRNLSVNARDRPAA